MRGIVLCLVFTFCKISMDFRELDCHGHLCSDMLITNSSYIGAIYRER